MIFHYYAFIIFSFINIYTSLPSDKIWKKALSNIELGKMIINKDKTHFIFDESNYTSLDINSRKMNILYQKQENISEKYGVSNYIFIVDHLDEKEESIEEAAINLCKYLKNYYNINMDKSIVALFSIETRKVRIKTGKKTKYYLNNDILKAMNEKLVPILRRENYYKAWFILLEDINYYCYNNYNFFSNYQGEFFLGIFTLIIAYNLIKKYFKFETVTKKVIKNSISLDDDIYLRKIVNFLKKQKSNKRILIDNCIICLEKLKYNKSNDNEEIDTEEKDSFGEEKKIEEKNGISILDCGHRYHTDCISKWKGWKNECPLCRQKNNNKYNKDDAHMVWGVQNEICGNSYNFINYNDLFYKNKFIDYSYTEKHNVKFKKSNSNDENNDYNDDYDYFYDYNRERNKEGGATGKW